jgi:hypothetical protein
VTELRRLAREIVETMFDQVEWQPVELHEPHDTLPYATHTGTVRVGQWTLRCFQLSDGSRVFAHEDVARMLGDGNQAHWPDAEGEE